MTYTATIAVTAPGAGSPTGTVAFNDGGTTITGCGSQPVSGSGPFTATCAVTYPGTGTHTIGAVYSGDANLQTSTSSALSQIVNLPDTFTVSGASPQVAGVSFAVTLTAKLPGGVTTDTSYSGTQVVAFTGPGNSPGGATPTYPANVSFTAGIGTATITLVDAQTTTLTATQGLITGTSSSIVVNAATSKGLSFSSQSLTGSGSPAETCSNPHTCTITGLKKGGNGTWISKISVVDAFDNPTTASGTVTVTLPAKDSLNKGSNSPTTLTITSGTTESTSSFTYTSGNGAYGPATVTVTGSGGGVTSSASCSITTV